MNIQSFPLSLINANLSKTNNFLLVSRQRHYCNKSVALLMLGLRDLFVIVICFNFVFLELSRLGKSRLFNFSEKHRQLLGPARLKLHTVHDLFP